MWYWDYIPTWSHHVKKPLTKAQIKKIQENYMKADDLSKKIKESEEREKNENKNITINFF